jgi:SAM-dependent methyltransferase
MRVSRFARRNPDYGAAAFKSAEHADQGLGISSGDRFSRAMKDTFDMRLRDSDSRTVCSERDVYNELLPLAGARVAELGCGRAELTRAIAEEFPTTQITALEVDAIQHARNLAINDLANVRFVAGGAEALPLDDDSVDLVLMFKSLHHVPSDLLDTALEEVRRVLVPGGLAYISEPVFAGEYNEIMRIFHDEERVRAAAFSAITRSVATGALEFVTERFFNTPLRFDDFAHFEDRVLGVTHTQHRLSESQLSAVRERFARHVTPQGVKFLQPMRVDLLRKPASVALATPGF